MTDDQVIMRMFDDKLTDLDKRRKRAFKTKDADVVYQCNFAIQEILDLRKTVGQYTTWIGEEDRMGR